MGIVQTTVFQSRPIWSTKQSHPVQSFTWPVSVLSGVIDFNGPDCAYAGLAQNVSQLHLPSCCDSGVYALSWVILFSRVNSIFFFTLAYISVHCDKVIKMRSKYNTWFKLEQAEKWPCDLAHVMYLTRIDLALLPFLLLY